MSELLKDTFVQKKSRVHILATVNDEPDQLQTFCFYVLHHGITIHRRNSIRDLYRETLLLKKAPKYNCFIIILTACPKIVKTVPDSNSACQWRFIKYVEDVPYIPHYYRDLDKLWPLDFKLESFFCMPQLWLIEKYLGQRCCRWCLAKMKTPDKNVKRHRRNSSPWVTLETRRVGKIRNLDLL